MTNKVLFVIILLLALILRVYQLDKLPPALNWDEVSIGYSAFSILKTGHDEWGESFPLSFKAYGDYKLPGYIYLDVPFIALFGLNEWGVRLPSALLGVGVVLSIFLIIKKVTGRIHVALWGMFLAAILPWLIIFSRIALEANLSLFLTTAGVYLFIIGLEKKWLLSLSAVMFGLSIFSYNSGRVVAPLLILLLSVLYYKPLISPREVIKFSIISLIIFIAFFSVAFPKALQQDSSARYKWTTILDEGAINRINELRGSSAFPPTLAYITYNKVTFLIPEFFKNYLSHFDPQFLFINGGSNYQFSVPGSGLIYPILAPFLILGLISLIKSKSKWGLFIVSWMLAGIVPAAITRDAPHALRSLMIIPPLIIITVLGIDFCFNVNHWIKDRKMILTAALSICLLISLLLFWQNYSGDYAKKYSWSWQYGYKEVINFVYQNPQYNQIFFSKKYGEPHEFVLFYTKFDPEKYQTDPNLNRYGRSDWFWVDSFDKFVFLNDWEVISKAACDNLKKCLLVTSPGNSPGGQVVKTIDFLDGKRAFDIVELP